MTERDKQVLLLAAGIGLVAFGHRMMDAELGKLGLPHVVGGLLLTAALRA
jgi:hypothetical protein